MGCFKHYQIRFKETIICKHVNLYLKTAGLLLELVDVRLILLRQCIAFLADEPQRLFLLQVKHKRIYQHLLIWKHSACNMMAGKCCRSITSKGHPPGAEREVQLSDRSLYGTSSSSILRYQNGNIMPEGDNKNCIGMMKKSKIRVWMISGNQTTFDSIHWMECWKSQTMRLKTNPGRTCCSFVASSEFSAISFSIWRVKFGSGRSCPFCSWTQNETYTSSICGTATVQ